RRHGLLPPDLVARLFAPKPPATAANPEAFLRRTVLRYAQDPTAARSALRVLAGEVFETSEGGPGTAAGGAPGHRARGGPAPRQAVRPAGDVPSPSPGGASPLPIGGGRGPGRGAPRRSPDRAVQAGARDGGRTSQPGDGV